MIVTEANAEARKVLRDAITEKEQVMGDVRRVQALLRSALAVVDEGHPGAGEGRRREGDDGTTSSAPGTGLDRVRRRRPQLPPVSLPPRSDSDDVRKLAG